MAFNVHHAVIHNISKSKNTQILGPVTKKDVLLPLENPAVVSLVEGVNALLGKKGNMLSYGQFGDDMRQGTFPADFAGYLESPQSPPEFLSLSHRSVDLLAEQAALEPLATGGHILVASYESDGVPFLLVAMIKERGGIQLDENYIPKEIVEVDMSKVHQAARINIRRYIDFSGVNDVENDDDIEVPDRTYLSFLGSRADSLAAGYFVKALGCTKGIASSRATNNVILAVAEFFAREDLRPFRAKAKNAVTNYLQQQSELGHDAVLSAIAFCATGALAGRQEEVVEELRVYLNSDEVKVPAVFPVHKGTLDRATRIKADTTNWSVQFERQLLGSTPDSVIYFDPRNKTLTFQDVSDAAIKEIEAELALRN